MSTSYEEAEGSTTTDVPTGKIYSNCDGDGDCNGDVTLVNGAGGEGGGRSSSRNIVADAHPPFISMRVGIDLIGRESDAGAGREGRDLDIAVSSKHSDVEQSEDSTSLTSLDSTASFGPCYSSNLMNSLELSIHSNLPRNFKIEAGYVFNNIMDKSKTKSDRDGTGDSGDAVKRDAFNLECLTVVPTFQRAIFDLAAIGPHIEDEKDRLLECFFRFAKALCSDLIKKGYWSDYIDPCSGLPMLSPGCNKVYGEVNGAQSLLKFKTLNSGCCKLLVHPVFGTAVYPSTMFTMAPSEVVVDSIRTLFQVL